MRVTEFVWTPYPAPRSEPKAGDDELDLADRERQIDQMIDRLNSACPQESTIDWERLDSLGEPMYTATTMAELEAAIAKYEEAAMAMFTAPDG